MKKGKVYVSVRKSGTAIKIRIISPRGVARYQFTDIMDGENFYDIDKGELSCFNKPKASQEDTIKAAKDYDKKEKWKTIYLGEL